MVQHSKEAQYNADPVLCYKDIYKSYFIDSCSNFYRNTFLSTKEWSTDVIENLL